MSGKREVSEPHCETCERVVGLKAGQDLQFRFATYIQADRTFEDVPSKKFLYKGEPTGAWACSPTCGVKSCKRDQFVISVMQEGEGFIVHAAWDHRGIQQERFWEDAYTNPAV